MIRLVRAVVMVVVWVALWSDLSLGTLTSGVLVALAVSLLVEPWRDGRFVVRPVHLTRFALFFLYKLVQSSVVVARAVISPRDRIHTGIVGVPLRGCTEAVATVVADAISLTPGTLTIEVARDPLTLYVHALDVRDVEAVRADVRKLEILAVRALGSPEAVADVAIDDTFSWRGP